MGPDVVTLFFLPILRRLMETPNRDALTDASQSKGLGAPIKLCYPNLVDLTVFQILTERSKGIGHSPDLGDFVEDNSASRNYLEHQTQKRIPRRQEDWKPVAQDEANRGMRKLKTSRRTFGL